MGNYSNRMKFPLCDTDIWVQLHRVSKEYIFFQTFESIFMADAVKYELDYLSDEYEDCFETAFLSFCSRCKSEEIKEMNFPDNEIFSEGQRRMLRRKFSEHKIPYDYKQNCYIDPKKNLGETVSVLYAGTLELPLILSSDKETPDLAKKNYDWLNVLNVGGVMRMLGVDETEIQSTYDEILKLPKIEKVEKITERDIVKLKRRFCN